MSILETIENEASLTHKVHAKWINDRQFGFECPFCYNKYKKNGQPYANAKHIEHCHGSCGKTNNRVERRVPHCEKVCGAYDFLIVIDNETLRE